MSDPRLDEIEARANAAVSGPWRECGRDRDGCICGLVWSIPADAVVASTASDEDAPKTLDQVNADARFVAHAREDVPYLLARVRELEARLNGDGV